MNTNTINRVTAEINQLVESGIELSDILVSVNQNGEAIWGEATALESDEMESAMENCGMSTEGMIRANEFINNYAVPTL